MLKKDTRKPKIVFITEYFPSKETIDVSGGVEIRTYYIAKELAKKNEVIVIASKEIKKPAEQILQNIKVIRVGKERTYTQKNDFLNRVLFIFLSVKLIIIIRPDIIEGSGLLGQLVAFTVSKFIKTKIIAFVPDLFSGFSSYFGLLQKYILIIAEKVLLNNSWDGFIVISNTVLNKLIQFKISGHKIKLIYCPVNNKLLSSIKVKKTSYPSICAITRLVKYKKVDVLIRALGFLKEDFPDIKCNIIGVGPELNFLTKIVNDLKLKNNLSFLGKLTDYKDVIKLLKKGWVYTSASVVEGFGIATVEAMMLGIPYVIPRTPVNKEITSGKGGLFYKPEDARELAVKLTELLKNTRLRETIVANNYVVARKYYLASIIKETGLYYKTLLNRG